MWGGAGRRIGEGLLQNVIIVIIFHESAGFQYQKFKAAVFSCTIVVHLPPTPHLPNIMFFLLADKKTLLAFFWQRMD